MSCQLICPNLRCRKVLKVPDEARGKVVRCQYCQTMLRVPPAKRPEATGPGTPGQTASATAAQASGSTRNVA